MFPFSTLLIKAIFRTISLDLLSWTRVVLTDDIFIKMEDKVHSIPKGTKGIVMNGKAHFFDSRSRLCAFDYRWIDKLSKVPAKKIQKPILILQKYVNQETQI